MIDKQFDKETFKKSVKDNVKFLYSRKLEEATQEQLFHRTLMKSRIRRSYIICPWSFLWDVPLETTF